MKKSLFAVVFMLAVSSLFSQINPLLGTLKREHVYPNGRLEVSFLGSLNTYFGEFDNNTGSEFGIQTKYNLPFLPFLGLGARYSTGNLSYVREFKDRFSIFYYEQFPVEYYENSQSRNIKKETQITNFSLLAFVNLFPNSKLNIYFQGGWGVLRYQNEDIVNAPRDEIGQKLLYKDFKDQDEFDYNWFAGFGADYHLNRDLTIGLQGSFKFLNTDLLDGFAHTPYGKKTENDYYFDYGIKVSYYLFYDEDFDGDGISNEDEFRKGTNPYSIDSDNDGINDIQEVQYYNSDPRKKDTDGDGLTDGQELVFKTKLNNPDSDEDGLNDYKEVFLYKSDPNDTDTDKDGLGDSAEIESGTNIHNKDSDDDGFNDFEDNCPAVFGLYRFNGCPQKDPIFVEKIVRDTLVRKVAQDTIYLVKEIKSFVNGNIFVPRGIFFQKNSAEILIESELTLDDIAIWLSKNRNKIEIHGHTDGDGENKFNKSLSLARANTVREYLIKYGISKNRLVAKGFGSERPVTSNLTAKDKAKNRRIEFLMYDEFSSRK